MEGEGGDSVTGGGSRGAALDQQAARTCRRERRGEGGERMREVGGGRKKEREGGGNERERETEREGDEV